MHITNRRHSMVFAALNNVSSVVIKDNSGDMLNHQSSVANELGMKNNIINIQSNPSLIYSNILRIWKNKSKMEKTIRL